jgi:hypothetical protein
MSMQIQIRITHDGKVFEGGATLSQVLSRSSAPKKPDHASRHQHATKPAGALDSLYNTGYFANERTLPDVRGQLQQGGYNFGAPSVLMALRSKAYLQRRGSKGSYRFVQKYPPASN